jgi:arylsulfatase A-like enzyme/Flp pilus assembly protein TadD
MVSKAKLASAFCGTCVACSAAQPDVLLVSVDTVRADALGVYGGPAGVSPALDALAARGVYARDAFASAPLTLPSHSTILTGLYVDRHGVLDNGRMGLPPTTTLAGLLRAKGYQTGAFVGAAVLDSSFGLDQGFDRYSDGFELLGPAMAGSVPQWDGAEVVERALAWASGLSPERPAFVWVHLYDAHYPREPIEPFVSMFPGDGYSAEIAEVDALVGQVIDGWAERRHRAPVVLVTGDHGESFGAHGEQTHGWFAYRATTHVPLILAGPGVAPSGALSGIWSTADVAPTLLELAGVEAPPDLDGRSLLRAAELKVDERLVYVESWSPRLGFGHQEVRALVSVTERAILAPRPEVYDWRADPGEVVDRAGDRWAHWEPRFVAWEQRTARVALPTADVSDALSDQLLALGYVAGPGALAPAQLPDAKDSPALNERWFLVMNSARSQPPAQGLPLIEGFLEAYPAVHSAQLLRARALVLLGRLGDARDVLEPLVEQTGLDPSLVVELSRVDLAAGDAVRARARLPSALKANPGDPELRLQLARTFAAEGRWGDCVASLNALLDRRVDHAGALAARGMCWVEGGNDAAGREDLERSLALDKAQLGVRSTLALALARSGDLARAQELLLEELTLDPSSKDTSAALGVVSAAVGDWEQAMVHLAPLWEDEAYGPDTAAAWAAALEAVGGNGEEVARARLEAERRRRSPAAPPGE